MLLFAEIETSGSREEKRDKTKLTLIDEFQLLLVRIKMKFFFETIGKRQRYVICNKLKKNVVEKLKKQYQVKKYFNSDGSNHYIIYF